MLSPLFRLLAWLFTLLTSLFTLGGLRTVGTGLVLVLVVVLDNAFRNDVYGRSDPLSFSLLGYSFLLVVSDSFLRILQSIRPGPPVHVEMAPSFLIAALVYVILLFVVFFRARNAHKRFQAAQERAVQNYVEALRRNTPGVDDGVWRALEKLGTETIEPDVFVNRQAKEDRRRDYLQLVKNLANAEIDPSNDQSKLLVNEPKVRRWARFWYVATAIFGIVSALYFFFVR